MRESERVWPLLIPLQAMLLQVTTSTEPSWRFPGLVRSARSGSIPSAPSAPLEVELRCLHEAKVLAWLPLAAALAFLLVAVHSSSIPRLGPRPS